MDHQHTQQSLSYAAFLILTSLDAEPKTVTALCQAVSQASGEVIEPAAFSRVVARLERRSWIAGEESGERLRLYHLTTSGMLALRQAQGPYRQDQEEQEWNGWIPGLHGGKEIIMRLVLWILRLYPPAWRERYETEMAALLEQHHLTLWTVLDLLVGALDARLDPHYRRGQQLLSLRRFRTSWRLVIAAFAVFWIALLPWFWISVLGVGPDARCYEWRAGYALCMMRVTVGMHMASLAQTLLGDILDWLPVLLMVFTAILVLARGRKAHTHLLLAFPVTMGMLALCMACGVWLSILWPVLPQISQFYPQTPAELLAGLLGMALATALALGSLVRAAFALRVLSTTAPKQAAHTSSSYTEESEPIPGPDIPHLEHPTASAGGSRESSVPGGWVVLLVALVLLFLLPWPKLLSSDAPDLSGLLITWGLAGIVGIITAWLVKAPGKQQAQRATPQPYRVIHALLWAAMLSLPALIATLQVAMYTIPDVSLPLAVKLGHLLVFLIPPVLIGTVTVLIIQIHRRWPRRGRALKNWGIFLLSILYVMVFPRFETMPPGVSFMGPPLILVCLVIAICIIPALLVRRHHTHKQAARTAQQAENEVSAWVWIMSLPIVFLLFCTEGEFMIGPDYNNFGDVFVVWCMAGLASLIILLALKIGSRKRTHSLPEETLQSVQVQG
jgi:DNA-binding MarR family transcriptional regulator